MSKKINPIHYKKLIKVFEKDGWVLDRTEGDHMVYVKDGYIRPVVIPCYSGIPIFIILNNIKTAKISRDKYLKLLK